VHHGPRGRSVEEDAALRKKSGYQMLLILKDMEGRSKSGGFGGNGGVLGQLGSVLDRPGAPFRLVDIPLVHPYLSGALLVVRLSVLLHNPFPHLHLASVGPLWATKNIHTGNSPEHSGQARPHWPSLF
jgi:hypothetical protein